MALDAESPLIRGSYAMGTDARAAADISPAAATYALPTGNVTVAKPCPDEPDAGNPHVRICGSPGERAYLLAPRGRPGGKFKKARENGSRRAGRVSVSASV